MAGYHKLKINSIEALTSEASSIGFEIPDSKKELFNFTSGQYINLKATIKSEEVRRSYSLCSAPSEGLLKVGVKRISNGVFSSYATQELKVGDVLEVGEPEGRFVYNKEAKTAQPLLQEVGLRLFTPLLKLFFLRVETLILP